jgi:hypothetical protein
MASELRVDRIIPVNGVPTGGGGGIIQITSGTLNPSSTSTLVSENSPISNTDGVEVGTATITPISNTSKILCIVSSQIAGGNNSTAVAALFRGSTNIAQRMYYSGSASNNGTNPFFIYHIDSPATTSSITYSVRLGSNNASYTQYMARSYNNSPSFYFTETQGQIILMEVSG